MGVLPAYRNDLQLTHVHSPHCRKQYHCLEVKTTASLTENAKKVGTGLTPQRAGEAFWAVKIERKETMRSKMAVPPPPLSLLPKPYYNTLWEFLLNR